MATKGDTPTKTERDLIVWGMHAIQQVVFADDPVERRHWLHQLDGICQELKPTP